MEKLEEITNCQKPEHFYKLKKNARTKIFGSKKRAYGTRHPPHTYIHTFSNYVNLVPTKSEKASTNYRDPTVLHTFLSFSTVSITVDLQINPLRPNPSHSATQSVFPIWCKNCKPVHPP